MKMIRILMLLLAFATAGILNASLPTYRIITDNVPEGSPGHIIRYAVASPQLDDEIIVDVWTPEGYDVEASVRYPVIYAHDGQNLFDPKFSFANVAWELDSQTQKLIDIGEIAAPIIVGINNRGSKNMRASDYFPEKALGFIPEGDESKTAIFKTVNNLFTGNKHSEFVAKSLKPLIDSLYATNPERSHTFTMGSSMGALASLYLLCEYPDIFGGAACMSTHWIGSLDLNPDYTMNDDPICADAILHYMNAYLPSPDHHRLYLDEGTEGWDAGYLKYEKRACQIAMDHGYSVAGGTLCLYEDQGAGHNEWYWQQRVDRPLKFLLNPDALSACVKTITTPNRGFNLYIDLFGTIYRTSEASLPKGIYIHKGNKIIIN